MSDRERFYAARDRRTVQYGVDPVLLEQQIAVVLGEDAAASRPGQVAVLSLVNMLARIHRSLAVVLPAAPLLAQTIVPARDLRDAVVRTATAIDPFIAVEVVERRPSGAPSIGMGHLVPGGFDLYIGADGALAILSDEPKPISPSDTSILGSGLAASLAAADILHLVLTGARPFPRQVSSWGFGEDARADRGPASLGPVDVGDVLVVGGGAVASCLLYWLREIGTTGAWEVVDGDIVELHNTNRSLGLLAADAGWPESDPANKAERAASLIGATSYVGWYDEWLREHDAARPDLVLPLANDRGVRHAIGNRGEPLLMSATTSPHESAALHRQVAGRDDCMDCRFPDASVPAFECSTGQVETGTDTSTDAALPFLSAAAGMLLASGLIQLQTGTITQLPESQWTLWVATRNRSWQWSRRQCRAGCQSALPPEVLRAINTNSRTWQPGRTASQ